MRATFIAVCIGLAPGCLLPAHAWSQTAHSSGATELGTVNVGSASPTVLVPFTFDSGGTLGGWGVYTQGATGLDYTEVTASTTCSTTATYHTGDTCSVAVQFKPAHPGLRMGAVQLMDSSKNPIATAPLHGIGFGPQIVFPRYNSEDQQGGAQLVASLPGGNSQGGVAIDGSGDLFTPGLNSLLEYKAVDGKVSPDAAVINLPSSAFGVAVDGAGNVFAGDNYQNLVIEVVAVNGQVSASSPVVTVGSGFKDPWGVAIDGKGNVFVADIENVKEIVAVNGVVSSGSQIIPLGGPAEGIAVDGSGDIYAGYVDTVTKITVASDGTTSQSPIYTWPPNYVGTNVEPNGLAVDAAGDLFVALLNGDLEEFPATGGEIPAGSIPISLGNRLNYPFGVAIDASGNLFAALYQGVRAKITYPLVEIPVATPPSLNVDVDTIQAPAALVANDGNAPLLFPIPASGNNPSVSSNFSWDISSTCSQTGSESLTEFSLAPGPACTIAIDFTPDAAATGAQSGSVTLTDNNLNNAAPADATQTINISATVAPFGEVGAPIDATTHQYHYVCNCDDLQVSGWAVDPHDGAPVSQVQILIDGAGVGNATLGGARPAVATNLGSRYLESGWTFTLPAAGLSLGKHLLSALMTDSLGFSATMRSQWFDVVSTSFYMPFGAIGSAVDAATLATSVSQSDNLLVSGWTADVHDGAPVSRVEIQIDSSTVGYATLGSPRPAVAAMYGSAYLRSGRTFQYPAATLLVGNHTLTAVATDSLGNVNAMQTTFTVTLSSVEGPPFGIVGEAVDATTLSSTVSPSDSLLVLGWACDPKDGAPVGGGVQILIDGVAAGTATLAIPRHDVAAARGSACLNSGWRFTMPASGLSAGTHIVKVVASDSLGNTSTLGYNAITVSP